MNYRGAAHVLGMGMNAQLRRGFDERKTSRVFFERRRRNSKKMQPRTSECVGMQSGGFLTLFLGLKRICFV